MRRFVDGEDGKWVCTSVQISYFGCCIEGRVLLLYSVGLESGEIIGMVPLRGCVHVFQEAMDG